MNRSDGHPRCPNCGYERTDPSPVCPECGVSMRRASRAAARRSRNTTLYLFVGGMLAITALTVGLAGPADLMAFVVVACLVELPAVLPVCCYVAYARTNQPAPMPRRDVVLGGLVCAASSIVGALVFDLSAGPIDPNLAPPLIYLGLAAFNAMVVWSLWVLTSRERG